MTSFLASSCKGVNVSIEFSLLMLLEGALIKKPKILGCFNVSFIFQLTRFQTFSFFPHFFRFLQKQDRAYEYFIIYYHCSKT